MGATANSCKEREKAYRQLDGLRQKIMDSRIDRGQLMRTYQETEEWISHLMLVRSMDHWSHSGDYAEDEEFIRLGLDIDFIRTQAKYWRVPSELLETHP